MKTLKYVAAIIILSASMAACKGDRTKATLGGTADTSTVAGANGSGSGADTAKAYSTNKGNVDPAGHGATDTTSKPVH
ncbi:hypothetical protein FFF34_015775 [Inquilinus sp. KBS0705]|nr:hypothetical protein FFF34_015775 [Inquilinus sp. KBS0705]